MSEPTLIFAIDHRPIMARACEERGEPDGAARIAEFKRLAVDAVLAARAARPDAAGRMAILLDDIYGPVAIAAARAAGIPVAQPGEKGGVSPLEFARPDWREAIVATRPAFLKVRIDGSPDDAPAARTQEQRLLEISRACEAAGVPLVPEPLLPEGTPEPAEKNRALDRRASALGIRARWWKIEGFDDPRAAQQVADSLPPSEGILILGKSAPLERVAQWFRSTRGSDRFEGFAVGRTIFWQPFLAHLAGTSHADTVSELTRAFLAVVDLWEKES